MEHGHREEALAVGYEVVGLHRRLAAADAAANSPGLATSLLNFGYRLLAADRPEGAWQALREASELFRQLTGTGTEPYPLVLAMLLDNLCIRLMEEKHATEALAVAEESVRVYRVLEQAEPGMHLGGLAGALDRLGFVLWELGQPEPALAATDEAVRLFRSWHGVTGRDTRQCWRGSSITWGCATGA